MRRLFSTKPAWSDPRETRTGTSLSEPLAAGGRGWKGWESDGPGGPRMGGWPGPQSKIGSLVRLRFSSKKPSVPATASTPSQSLAAASPRGIGETTGPKKDTPSTEITGVPTSYPTRSMPSAVDTRSASSYDGSSIASARSAGRPASASAASTVARSFGAFSWWNRVPSAVYSGSSTSGPNFCSAAIATRTGPHAWAISSRYCSGRSLPSLTTARLITCQRAATGRTFSTSSSQRDAIQAHGHSGSNQKSTGVGSCWAMGTPPGGGGDPADNRGAGRVIPQAHVRLFSPASDRERDHGSDQQPHAQ